MKNKNEAKTGLSNKEKLEYLNEVCGTDYRSLDDVEWWYLASEKKLTEGIIRQNKNRFYPERCWRDISASQRLSEDFIREFENVLYWPYISYFQKLSEDFIREFKNKVEWSFISSRQELSEDFIREFSDRVSWPQISTFQKLSEDFIREFSENVNWCFISIFQRLSEDFIREFQDRVDFVYISKYQKLSDDFIKEFNGRVDLELIEDNWAYKDSDFLKKQVVSTGLYECHDDHFIAYKGIRSNRWSRFSFHYQYQPGCTYDSFCDCSGDPNSFGFSVWTKDKASEYCDELVVRVRVDYADVGRVVHDGGKIRCRKITILD